MATRRRRSSTSMARSSTLTAACEPREAVTVDGEPVGEPCPEPGCWGRQGHRELHADGSSRWTSKGRLA